MERDAIKGAPIHFAVACFIAALITGASWYVAFSTALTLKSNTIQAYKDRFGDLSSSQTDQLQKRLRATEVSYNAEKLAGQIDHFAKDWYYNVFSNETAKAVSERFDLKFHQRLQTAHNDLLSFGQRSDKLDRLMLAERSPANLHDVAELLRGLADGVHE